MTKNEIIENFARELASEMANRNIFNMDEFVALIKTRFRIAYSDIINTESEKHEKEYYELLERQSKNRIGSAAYIETAYKLSAAKYKKKTLNRLQNKEQQQNKIKIQGHVSGGNLLSFDEIENL